MPRVTRGVRSRLLPDAVQELDLSLFRRTAARHSPLLDKTLPRLTRWANHSLLWASIAVALNVLGGRFSRRAALRGMFAVGITSFVTNVPAKLLWRRPRPAIDVVPQIRRLARLPISTSFPSGHAASAFAFASGVALEKPVLAIPMFGLAGAVAYSRVYVGVHYPSDVIAGAAIGASLAMATRRFWPVVEDEPAGARPSAEGSPAPSGEGLAVVVNPQAGPALGRSASEEIRRLLPRAEVIEVGEGGSVQAALERAAAGADAIGACGGDGTVNAAAETALASGKPLVVFPGGTLNHFARDVGFESLRDVASALESGRTVAVDVSRIAGEPFVNTASFGSYVALVDARERLEKRIGKWPALAVALVRVLRNAQPVKVEIDGKATSVWMCFIGNCRYQPAGFAPTTRSRLDDGLLDLRVVDASHPFARARLVWAVLTGTLHRSRVYRAWTTRGPVHVRCLEGPMRLARDGETFSGPSDFTIEKATERMKVLSPSES